LVDLFSQQADHSIFRRPFFKKLSPRRPLRPRPELTAPAGSENLAPSRKRRLGSKNSSPPITSPPAPQDKHAAGTPRRNLTIRSEEPRLSWPMLDPNRSTHALLLGIAFALAMAGAPRTSPGATPQKTTITFEPVDRATIGARFARLWPVNWDRERELKG